MLTEWWLMSINLQSLVLISKNPLHIKNLCPPENLLRGAPPASGISSLVPSSSTDCATAPATWPFVLSECSSSPVSSGSPAKREVLF